MRDLNLRSFPGIKLRNRIPYVIITAIIISMLCGCNVSENDIFEKSETKDDSSTTPGAISVIDINGDVHEASVDVIDETEAENEQDQTTTLPSRTLAQVAQNISLSDEKNYAYSGLDDSARVCYQEIYAILLDMLEKVELSSRSSEEIDLAFRAVMVDHPEIFYVKGYSIGKYVKGSEIRKIVFTGTYTMSPDEVKRNRELVDEYVKDFVASVPEGGEYDKIKYVYDKLIRENEYVPDSENNQNILSVVKNSQTVCQGYTKAMQLILGRMGIFCTLVNGKACGRNGVPDAEELKNAGSAEWGGHVWNIVRCNGLYYNVDVTWGDAAITLMNADGSVSHEIDINYEFFLVDDNSLVGTHEPEPVVRMPQCISMEDNYYRHEGLYFTSVDDTQLARAFESAYSSGDGHVFLKAADSMVFDDLERYLFTNQNIFGYLGRTNVRYVEFPERDLIMISL